MILFKQKNNVYLIIIKIFSQIINKMKKNISSKQKIHPHKIKFSIRYNNLKIMIKIDNIVIMIKN